MGIHVEKTVRIRKNLRPQMSDRAPMRGALRKDKAPLKKSHIKMHLKIQVAVICTPTLIPKMNPFMRNLFEGNVSARTLKIQLFTVIIIDSSSIHSYIYYRHCQQSPCKKLQENYNQCMPQRRFADP